LSASGSLPPLKLGLFVPGLGNTEILDPVCNEISRFAQSLGFTVLQEDPAQDGPHALQICRQLIEMPVSGVFFSPLEAVPDRALWNRRIANEFLKNGIPLLLLDRDIDEFPVRSEFDLVGIDNVAAGIEITSHLIGEGLRRICFLARKNYPSTTDLRLLGCREAIRRSGENLKDACAYFGDPTDAEFVRQMLEKEKPDAVLCSNDQTAALLIRTLGQLQIPIPADIAVAGFDDVQYATLLAPPLTTIKQPYRELGRSAVTMLLERISNPSLPPRQVLHSHQLMVRQSTDVRGSAQYHNRRRIASVQTV
jgi:DNA-binding LacI/PurR family transcriptional regulator